MSDILILGAHTAVGQAVYEALDDRDLADRAVRATTTDHVGPDLVLIDPAQLARAKVALVCFDDPFAVSLAEGADKLPCPVVDVAGVLEPGEAPLVGLTDVLPDRGAVRIPLGTAGAALAVLGALEDFRPRSVSAVSLEGTASFGEPGMEELSGQVRAVFTSQDAPMEVLGAPLAFGIRSGVDEEAPEAADERFADDLREGRGPEFRVSVRRLRVPVFTGEGLSLEVELDDAPESLEVLSDRLSAAPGLRLHEGVVSSLDAVNRDDALVGQLRLDGRFASMFVAVDRLRAGAAALAVAVAARRLEA